MFEIPSVLQRVAVCCIELQRAAMCCSVVRPCLFQEAYDFEHIQANKILNGALICITIWLVKYMQSALESNCRVVNKIHTYIIFTELPRSGWCSYMYYDNACKVHAVYIYIYT